MNTKKTLKLFLIIFLSFLFSKITSQIDLITLAQLGDLEVAAFCLPNRAMILDTIAAFAIAPVLSIFIEKDDNLCLAIKRALTIGLFVGVITAAANVFLSPLLIEFASPNEPIKNLGKVGIFWLTLSIPIRMVSFIATMTLFGRNMGKCIIFVNLCEFLLKVILNYFLVFSPFNLGFKGVYISGFISSLVVFLMIYVLLIHVMEGSWFLFAKPSWGWFTKIFQQSKFEAIKIAIERSTVYLGLISFAKKSMSSSYLAVYSCASELQILFGIFSISIMRSLAISLAPQSNKIIILWEDGALRRLIAYILIGTSLLSFFFLVLYQPIGKSLYGLQTEAMNWWGPFIILFSISIPLQICEVMLRALWQANGLFKIPAILSIAYEVLIYLPITYFGIRCDNPWITWSPIVMGPIIICAVLYGYGIWHDSRNIGMESIST